MKNFLLVSLAGMASLASLASEALSVDDFRNPPRENRPETWFHFIGGNVAKKGVTADLEAIAGAGISGVQLFHGQAGSEWPGVKPQIKCLSDKWEDLVGFVADESRRLDLRFTMQNCPGWAMAGGPWIRPENAMRHLEWTRTDVEGGGRVEVKLPQKSPSAPDERDYRDVAVLAFPTPDGEWEKPLEPKSVKGNHGIDWNKWAKTGKSVFIQNGRLTRIEFEFAEPVTVRTLELPPVNSMSRAWCYDPQMNVRCEADGKEILNCALPGANWQDGSAVSFALDEITARTFVVTLETSHIYWLGRIAFYESAHNDDWEAQAGWTMRTLMRNPPRAQSAKAWVCASQVRDLSSAMKKDGTLQWDAPEGKWTILRVGHVNTLRKNGPAPKEATGFECDKLSSKGAEIHFENYIGRLSREGGAVHGKIANMLLDSWECKCQTWTEGLDGVFAKKMGYGLLSWMPALFGYVVDDPSASARFLNDWRALVAGEISENFYGRMAKLSHDRGMTISFETAFGDVIPGDIMEYYRHADVPMCEFWQPREPSFVGSFDFKPVRPCVSAAHLYGKKRVAAEAFTSFTLTWDEKLRDLKHIANIHLAEGISHLIFHTYTHNPRTDFLPPGTSFGGSIGTPFLRDQTWWKFMPEFTAYLGRCQTMLETGKDVRDVLWYLGDEWDSRPKHDMPFPSGIRYDYCNPHALLTRLDANDAGEWQTLDGATYRVLWVPERCRRMMPETLAKILASAKKGAVVGFAALPEECSTLREGAGEEFQKVIEQLKACRRIYVGKTLDEVLKLEGIVPDFIGKGAQWSHRSSKEADWYFVAPQSQNVPFRGKVAFRAVGDAEVWDPQTGKIEKASNASCIDGYTWMNLDLAPHEARFVVFRKGPSIPSVLERKKKETFCPLFLNWSVSFPQGWGMPENVQLDKLKPWKDIGDTLEARAFSGTAEYSAEFDISEKTDSSAIYLDLGRVETLAEVEVNGVKVGKLWAYPYKVDITKAVKSGVNTLKVAVTDTWFNRLVYDAALPAAERRTWTINGPSKDKPLKESGLLGPVGIIYSL